MDAVGADEQVHGAPAHLEALPGLGTLPQQREPLVGGLVAQERDRTAEDEAMLAVLEPARVDLTDRAAIAPVVESCLR